jgi:excisionase family DNA binding protein
MTDRLLIARLLAEQLGVSPETVLRWARRGELPSIHLPGGAVRFREQEIERWLEERATSGRGSASHPEGRRPALGYPVLATPEDEED